MMKRYCYNMTFLVSAERRREQESWIALRVAHLRNTAGFTGCAARLALVTAVPGMSEYGQDETSLTAQFEFETLEDAQAWGDSHYPTLAGAYARAFGNQAYVMPAIIVQWEVE